MASDTLPLPVSPTITFQNPLHAMRMLYAVNITVCNPIKVKSNAKSSNSVAPTSLEVNKLRPRENVINQIMHANQNTYSKLLE